MSVMWLKALWWAFLILAPILIYVFMVRPQLHERPELAEFYAKADGFWDKVFRRLKGFRTFLVGFLGLIVTELPPLLTELQVVDLSAFFPEETARRIGQFIIITMILLRTVTTTRVGHKEPEPVDDEDEIIPDSEVQQDPDNQDGGSGG